jgi:DNA helicase-2/ATP-dependent DNA helicase PcrA
MIDLSPEKKRLLTTEGHILALGGPGSGKTFIALLKANAELEKGLLNAQQVLFLSFARATIARVEQQAKILIPAARNRVEINTYHSFSWNILRSHGHLLKKGNAIRLLPPPEAAAKLAEIDPALRDSEKLRLFQEEGFLHFDLFASLAGDILTKSKALRDIVCDAYPTIILDEFQDTNADEWKLIQCLGQKSRLIALADAEQRIYEFRGADPKRIGEFITTFSPSQFDFQSENNRSNGTDITIFGNDLLTGANRAKTYKDVAIVKYQVRKGNTLHFDAKVTILRACKRLNDSGKRGWSLAILVPTRQLMLDLSDFLSNEQTYSNTTKLPVVVHEVALETSGPALAAVTIAGLLEGAATKIEIAHRMINDLCGHIRGRKGGNDTVAQGELQLAGALGNYVGSGAIRGAKRKLVVDECIRIATERHALPLSGDPAEDWLIIRQLVSSSAADTVQKVAADARYLRLLHKGAVLRASLSDLWKRNGDYSGAVILVRDALLQEHFSASVKEWNGVHVMTIHKSKGKEFDEVIVYEGSHQGRFIRANADDKALAQARLTLRVAVTRAMKRSTILTPKHDVCPFL